MTILVSTGPDRNRPVWFALLIQARSASKWVSQAHQTHSLALRACIAAGSHRPQSMARPVGTGPTSAKGDLASRSQFQIADRAMLSRFPCSAASTPHRRSHRRWARTGRLLCRCREPPEHLPTSWGLCPKHRSVRHQVLELRALADLRCPVGSSFRRESEDGIGGLAVGRATGGSGVLIDRIGRAVHDPQMIHIGGINRDSTRVHIGTVNCPFSDQRA